MEIRFLKIETNAALAEIPPPGRARGVAVHLPKVPGPGPEPGRAGGAAGVGHGAC